MRKNEIIVELLAYLDEKGKYYDFLNWASERGFDPDELESDIERAVEDD